MTISEGKDLTVFVDESGIITKQHSDKDDYFIISLLCVENEKIPFLKKMFKKYRLQVVKRKAELLEELTVNKEVKGSSLSESEKNIIYSKILDKCTDGFELSIIVLNNNTTTQKFRSNSSRSFNYLIKEYLEIYFKRHSCFKNINSINFVIDERNVATGAKFTLEEYLNTELNLTEHFCDNDIKVHYADSKKYILLQMTDFISNTYFRYYQKKDKKAENNINLLNNRACNKKVFFFKNKK